MPLCRIFKDQRKLRIGIKNWQEAQLIMLQRNSLSDLKRQPKTPWILLYAQAKLLVASNSPLEACWLLYDWSNTENTTSKDESRWLSWIFIGVWCPLGQRLVLWTLLMLFRIVFLLAGSLLGHLSICCCSLHFAQMKSAVMVINTIFRLDGPLQSSLYARYLDNRRDLISWRWQRNSWGRKNFSTCNDFCLSIYPSLANAKIGMRSHQKQQHLQWQIAELKVQI